jgi:hypothetical protein
MKPQNAMTAQDMRFLTAVRNAFGEAAFSSADLFSRLSPADLPSHVQHGDGDPARMFGRWLASRVGWEYRGLTLQKLSRRYSVQQWKFGHLPDERPTGVGERMTMHLDETGKAYLWYWESLGLWPDEVAEL